MRAAAIQIANGVFLELEPIYDEGRRSFRFRSRLVSVFVLGSLNVLRLGVLENHHKTRAVGRPLEVVDALGRFGEAHGFSAKTVQKPHLALASVAGGEKCEIFAVGTPARMRRGNTFGGHGERISAVGRDHPEVLLTLVLLEHFGAHRVGHPLAVGAQFRLSNVANLEVVVNRDGARRNGNRDGSRLRVILLAARGDGKTKKQKSKDYARDTLHAHNSSMEEGMSNRERSVAEGPPDTD